MKVKGWKKIYYANRNHKRARMAILISSKINNVVTQLAAPVFVVPCKMDSLTQNLVPMSRPMTPHQRGMKRFITYIMRLSEGSKAGSQSLSENVLREQEKETGLGFFRCCS